MGEVVEDDIVEGSFYWNGKPTKRLTPRSVIAVNLVKANNYNWLLSGEQADTVLDSLLHWGYEVVKRVAEPAESPRSVIPLTLVESNSLSGEQADQIPDSLAHWGYEIVKQAVDPVELV